MQDYGTLADSDEADSYERYLDEIQHYVPLTREQEAEVARAVRAGDESALDRLVRANLRFVVKVALEYSGRGVPLLDLIAEGNMGLVEAARRFDERRECKFITYAVWWIRNRIHQELRRGARVVPLSWKQVEDRKKVRKELRSMTRKLEREVSEQEAAGAAGLAADEAPPPPEVSLDAPLSDDAEIALIDTLPESSLSADEILERRALADAVRDGLMGLEPREADVIRDYFGLDGSEPVTLHEIGEGMGVSRERARQLRNRGLGKLRHRCGVVLGEFAQN